MTAKLIPFIDWEQIRLNGGPPCFHVVPYNHPDIPDRPVFCGRADRWSGHQADVDHAFVPLDELLAAAEKRAEEAERLYADIANPKCLDDACGHLWREHEASGEDCEEPCLVAGCPCDAFEGESAAARFAALTSQLAAANAEIERLRELAYSLWMVICNVDSGNWYQPEEWRKAAERVRDEYFEVTGTGPLKAAAVNEAAKESK